MRLSSHAGNIPDLDIFGVRPTCCSALEAFDRRSVRRRAAPITADFGATG